MAKTLNPLHDRLLIRRLANDQTTESGIIIPDAAQEKAQSGEVVAVGPGRLADDGSRKPLSVKKGDQVLFGKYSGTEIKFNHEDLLIIKEDELLGVISN